MSAEPENQDSTEPKKQSYSDKLSEQLGGQFTEEQIRVCIKGGIIPPEALNDRDSIGLFFHTCAIAKANPMLKQAHMISYNTKIKGRNGQQDTWITKYATVFDYKFIRGKADTTGEWGGQDDITFNGGKTMDECIKEGLKHPTTATAIIYRVTNGVRFGTTFTVSWKEFSSRKPKWNIETGQPFHMLGKVAVSHCTRAAFPAATEGLFTPEEFDHVQAPIKDVQFQEVDILTPAMLRLAECTTANQAFKLEKEMGSTLNSNTEWTNAINSKVEELVQTEMEAPEEEAGQLEMELKEEDKSE